MSSEFTLQRVQSSRFSVCTVVGDCDKALEAATVLMQTYPEDYMKTVRNSESKKA
jgi:hypothetical protein